MFQFIQYIQSAFFKENKLAMEYIPDKIRSLKKLKFIVAQTIHTINVINIINFYKYKKKYLCQQIM